VNKLGTTEPIIQQSGENRIVVQMPGLQDTAKAKDILGRTAALEVHLVEDDPDMLAQAEAGNVPSGYLLATEERQGNQVPILLKSDVELTGDNINKASAGYTGDQTKAQEPAVFISLDSLGTEIFRQLTAENINKRMAMVLVEGGKLEVVTAPNINQEIGGGNVSITGSMTLPQANDVALLLGSGSL
jgi:preprotein translocase subunit SecD